MFDPIVRSARADDAIQLQLLEREARSALVGKRGGDRWLADNPERGTRWPDVVRDAEVFVGLIDEVIVGYIVGSVERNLARVDEPYVTPQARQCGFGDEMLAHLIDRFRELGATTLDGEALPGDRDTKNLYERAGIKARLIITTIPL